MRSVPEVLAAWRRACTPAPSRAVPVADAVGCVLGRDLVVPGPVPPRAIALRAGYAVAAEDLVGVSAYAPLVLTAPPSRLDAGDALPPGTDAVLPPDAVETDGPAVAILAEVAPGENVRRSGEDAPAGQVLRAAGQVLRPLDFAVAQAAGIGEAWIRPFTLRLAGERHNLAMLEGLAAHFRSGMRTEIADLPADDVEDASPALSSSAADLILVAAAGPALAALADSGSAPAGALALKGAETVLVGAGPPPLVVAPPRLDALVSLMLCLVRPHAAAVTGRAPQPVWRRARLNRKVVSPVGLTELVLVAETNGSLEPLGAGSITLASLATAEGFLVVPPDSEGFPDGATVEAYEV